MEDAAAQLACFHCSPGCCKSQLINAEDIIALLQHKIREIQDQDCITLYNSACVHRNETKCAQ